MGNVPKAGHRQSPAGSLHTAARGQHVGKDTASLRDTQTATQRGHSHGPALCHEQCCHCTEEPVPMSGHAALLCPWELCHLSLGRTPCIQPDILRQCVVQGLHDMGHWCHWDWAGSSSGAPVLPCPSSNIPLVPVPPVLSLLVPTSTVNCSRPWFLPSTTSEVLSAAWGCEGGTRGTGCSWGRACRGCRCLWDLSLYKVHMPPFSNPKP